MSVPSFWVVQDGEGTVTRAVAVDAAVDAEGDGTTRLEGGGGEAAGTTTVVSAIGAEATGIAAGWRGAEIADVVIGARVVMIDWRWGRTGTMGSVLAGRG